MSKAITASDYFDKQSDGSYNIPVDLCGAPVWHNWKDFNIITRKAVDSWGLEFHLEHSNEPNTAFIKCDNEIQWWDEKIAKGFQPNELNTHLSLAYLSYKKGNEMLPIKNGITTFRQMTKEEKMAKIQANKDRSRRLGKGVLEAIARIKNNTWRE